ncbi:MAG TPA: hypothetical protein VIN63_02350 [Candidatus Limnocylindria bacterium]
MPTPDDRIEDRRGFALHRRGHVRVQVQRDRDRRVPEHLGHDLRVPALTQ